MRTNYNRRLASNIARSAGLAVMLVAGTVVAAPGAVSDDPDFDLDLDPLRHAAPDGNHGRLMVVTMPEINLFPEPSVRSPRIGAFRNGDGVTVLERRIDDDGENWARVCSGSTCGWVGADFLEPAPGDEP